MKTNFKILRSCTEKEDFIKSTFGNELQNIFNHEIFLLVVLVVLVVVVVQQLDMYVMYLRRSTIEKQ